MMEAALDYAGRGWPVFPVDPNRGSGKQPYYGSHGVDDATCDITKVTAMWEKHPDANIGMNCGEAGFMTLDLDPGYKWEELVEKVGEVPETALRAHTPRGGEHLHFRLEDGEYVPPSASKLADNIDVRSATSYVLLPPSRSVDGEYTWHGTGREEPAFRTDRMANAAREGSRGSGENEDTWIIEPDQERHVHKAVDWLKHEARLAIEGSGGDATAVATASYMLSLGISEELAYDLMWEHWNPICEPPWAEEEMHHFRQKVRNGYAYHTSAPGNLTEEYHEVKREMASSIFKAVAKPMGTSDQATPSMVSGQVPTPTETFAGRYRFVDRAGLELVPDPTWAIPRFLPDRGYALMFGAPGTFKTFLAIDIGMSIAMGAGDADTTAWPEIPDPGSVCFSIGEGRPMFKKRIKAWEQHYNEGIQAPPGYVIIGDPVPSVSHEIEPFINGLLDKAPDGIKLLVIDTVGRAMQGVNENAQENASVFTQMVEALQMELGCAVLALHHAGHADGDRARGSSVFGADADTVVRLEREEGDIDAVQMHMVKQKDAGEWPEPKRFILPELTLPIMGPDGKLLKSLVARPAYASDPAPAAKAKKGKGTTTQKANQEIVSKQAQEKIVSIVKKVLRENPTKVWTQGALASKVALDDGCSVGSRTLANRLTAMREDKENGLARYVNADETTSGGIKWRWQEEPED